MTDRRSGTVSLVFTDIDGSTRLLAQLGDAYATLLDDHHRLVGTAMEAQGGERVDAAGDGLFFSFPTARGGPCSLHRGTASHRGTRLAASRRGQGTDGPSHR